MKGTALSEVKNCILVGHSSSGKTSLLEAMLYTAGATKRLGRVEDETSVGDYFDEEKKRKITMSAKPLHLAYKNKSIFVIDTPGYIDFHGDVVCSLRIAESAIITVCSVGGLEVGTQRSWRELEEYKLPRIIFINKIDKENSNFYKVVESIQNSFGIHCVPIVVPDGEENSFKGIVNLLEDTAGKGGDQARIEEYKGKLMDVIAEADDALLEKYLEAGTLSKEEMSTGLKKAVAETKLVPIVCGSAAQNKGIDSLLENIADLLPSPDQRKVERIKEGEISSVEKEAPLNALVFKVVSDPYVGQLSYLRIYSGTIKSDTEIMNSSKRKKERIGKIYLIQGKEQIAVEEGSAGDIVAIAKLKHTAIGDSFSAGNVIFDFIDLPKPTTSIAIRSKNKGDEDKIGTGLHKLAEEDPTLHLYRDKETKQTILAGMGDVHLDVTLERLKDKFNVEVESNIPKVAYKETIKKNAEGHEKYKKQSGGKGQYGEVYLKVEPLGRGKGFEFADKIVGGAIPKGFIPAVEKGIVGAMEEGILAGYPVVDLKTTLYDGSYHEVDSSEMAFKIAGSKGFKDAVLKAGLTLLEPIMNVEVTIPSDFMGDISGDLNSKRGRIAGMEPSGDLQKIKANVPSAEMFKYSSELRSMTGGRGTFSMEFSRYEEVPAKEQQAIVAQYQKQKEEENK